MIGCELFEDQFEAWKNDKLTEEERRKMQFHASSCPTCRAFDAETLHFRKLLEEIPMRSVPVGFEFKLNRRIENLEKNGNTAVVGKTSPIPRWASIGAGIATGVAIGVALLLPANQESQNSSYLASEQSQVRAQKGTTEILPAKADSIPDSTVKPESLYQLDDHSRAVSSEK